MTETAQTTSLSNSPIPADDPNRKLTVADPDGAGVRHVSVVGGLTQNWFRAMTQSGDIASSTCSCPTAPAHRRIATISRRCSVLEGELEFIFRGQTRTVRAGSTVNIPANAPHQFRNMSGKTVHMLSCARRQDKKSSSWRSASRSKAGRLRRRGPPRKCEPRKLGLLKTLSPKYRTEMVGDSTSR